MPCAIATIISADRATLDELQTTLGVLDAYNLLEVIAVDAHNRRVFIESKR